MQCIQQGMHPRPVARVGCLRQLRPKGERAGLHIACSRSLATRARSTLRGASVKRECSERDRPLPRVRRVPNMGGPKCGSGMGLAARLVIEVQYDDARRGDPREDHPHEGGFPVCEKQLLMPQQLPSLEA